MVSVANFDKKEATYGNSPINNMMSDISNLTLLVTPMVTTAVNIGMPLKEENMCCITRFTHGSMFALFTVIFSYWKVFIISSGFYVIGNFKMTGFALGVFSFLIAIVIIVINITLINQVPIKSLRRTLSMIALIFSVSLCFALIFHENIFNTTT